MGLFSKKESAAGQVDFDRLPRHIAIIMDGNGRWAKKRGLPRTAGHAVGAETFRTIANYCKDIGIHYLTVYAFSTENWKRPADEVSTIMKLLQRYLVEAIETVQRDKIRMDFFGDLDGLPDELRALCLRTREVSKNYDGVQVNLCLNYGGRDEIVQAAKAFAQACASGEATPDELDEKRLASYLYSKNVPDPDLIIRPSGENRISNFLLWQSAYSEYVIMDILWPDFTPEDLNFALREYAKRSRRFGGI